MILLLSEHHGDPRGVAMPPIFQRHSAAQASDALHGGGGRHGSVTQRNGPMIVAPGYAVHGLYAWAVSYMVRMFSSGASTWM